MADLETFNDLRPLLFSIAYRMLGSVMEAEDIVQEAYLRWDRAPADEVESPRAYLSAIVTRLSIDQLRSARMQRESYIGPWLPEPVLTEPDVSQVAEMSDSLSMAFLVLLERLSPVERAVFLLREVFGYEYSEIARLVDKSEDNCRQLLVRAKRHVESERPRYEASRKKQQELTERFVEAAAKGDLDGLVSMLAQDVTLWSDGGGRVKAARKPIYGADKVARFVLGIMRKEALDVTAFRFVMVNNQPGLLIYEGELQSVVALETDGETVQGIRLVSNPDKLRRLPSFDRPSTDAEPPSEGN